MQRAVVWVDAGYGNGNGVFWGAEGDGEGDRREERVGGMTRREIVRGLMVRGRGRRGDGLDVLYCIG